VIFCEKLLALTCMQNASDIIKISFIIRMALIKGEQGGPS
jgi:hypothetical protein